MRPSFYKITNIVSSADIGMELDLFTIAKKIKDVEYEPEQFPGAILKLKDQKASLLLFKNGRVVCVGCKTEKKIVETLNRVAKMLLPYATKILRTRKRVEYEITNIVASADLGVVLDLYAIAREFPDVEYEPEQFPGAILKFKKPRASMLLFKNGKVICAGAATEREVRTALYKARRMLKKFSRKRSYV